MGKRFVEQDDPWGQPEIPETNFDQAFAVLVLGLQIGGSFTIGYSRGNSTQSTLNLADFGLPHNPEGLVVSIADPAMIITRDSANTFLLNQIGYTTLRAAQVDAAGQVVSQSYNGARCSSGESWRLDFQGLIVEVNFPVTQKGTVPTQVGTMSESELQFNPINIPELTRLLTELSQSLYGEEIAAILGNIMELLPQNIGTITIADSIYALRPGVSWTIEQVKELAKIEV